MLGNRQLRLQLAMLGAWVGHPRELEALLLDAEMRDARLADAYCFVRADVRPELYGLAARMVRGESLPPDAFLTGTRRASTLRLGLDYLIAGLRDMRNLKSAAQLLLLLTSLDDSLWLLAEQAQRGQLPEDALDLQLRLRTLEQVQHMDKARFWRLHDALADGPVKQRLGALWSMDHRRACTDILTSARELDRG